MLRIALTLVLLTGFAVPAAAQYPERPLTLLTGYPRAAWWTSRRARSPRA